MRQADTEPADQEPDYIHNGAQTSGFIRFIDNFFSEGYESQHGKFQGLHPEWDTDDSDTQKNACDNIHQKDDQSPENDPNNISDNTHLSNKFRNINLWNFHLQFPGVYQN